MTIGTTLKLITENSDPVSYWLPIKNEKIHLNPYIGETINFTHTGVILCIACGQKTKKSFSQGYCFRCTRVLAACDMCILKPELCHFDKGTCREPDWAQSHCMQKHYIYLSNTSGLKVGITRHTQIPTRWIDQGATDALIIGEVENRLYSGLVEVAFKNFIADKTDWRKMLKGENTTEVDLLSKRDELLMHWPDDVVGEPLLDNEIVKIVYPVLEFPSKITSLNLDKNPKVEGVLLGIKGQYLILSTGVINMRKYQGYEINWQSN